MAAMAFAGCTRKVGDAVVLEKEHIAAADPSPTPTAKETGPAANPAGSPTPSAELSHEPIQTELAPDEIAVGSYVMRKELRGTSRDPRAIAEEQWLIKVEMGDDRSRFTISSDRAHFLKLKPGDRVRVSYKQGKYTGTIWGAKIED